LPQVPGNYAAQPIDSIFLGNGPMLDNWVTAADLSPDGKTLILLSHQCIWVIKDFTGSRFSSGTVVRLNFKHFSHKAGLCFADKSTLYIADEREFGVLGGKLYKVKLDHLLNPQ
jgi:hypothetical protein